MDNALSISDKDIRYNLVGGIGNRFRKGFSPKSKRDHRGELMEREEEEELTREEKLDYSAIHYLKGRPQNIREYAAKEITESVRERETPHKKALGKKPRPIRLFPTIRVRNRVILSPKITELYDAKKELMANLEGAIRFFVQEEESLSYCEEYATALIKKAPKKFRVKPAELKQIVRTIYESYLLSFEIRIEPEDWNIFIAAFQVPIKNTFMKQLEDSLQICIASKLSEQKEIKKARGPNRTRIDYINHIKNEASKLYSIIEFISKLSPDRWPHSFCQLIEKHKSCKGYFEKKRRINPELFTAFLLSQNHKQSMVKNDIYRFFDITIDHFNLKDFRRYLNDKECKKWGDSISYQFYNAVNKGNAKYLTKSGQKSPLVFTDRLAQRDDMRPCDQAGNIIEVTPCIEKGREVLEKYMLDKAVSMILPKSAN
jgi:hypothetical protein